MKQPFPVLHDNAPPEVLQEWSAIRKGGEFRFIWINSAGLIPLFWVSLLAMAGLYGILTQSLLFGIFGLSVGILGFAAAIILMFHAMWLRNERYFIGSNSRRPGQ